MYFSAAKLSLALSFVSSLPALKAQDGGGDSSSFLNDYLNFLNGTGYTSLSNALQQANSSDEGRRWIDQLSSGEWTVFASSNKAFQSANSSLTNDSDTLSSYLSYHYVYGNIFSSGNGGGGSNSRTASSTSTSTHTQSTSAQSTVSSPSGTASAYRLSNLFKSPQFLQSSNGGSGNGSAVGTVSIGRTLLSDDNFVSLEGPDGDERRHQVLAWVAEAGQITVLNLPMNVTVSNSTAWNNLHIANIDQILIPPGNLSSTLTAVHDTQLLNLLNVTQLPSNDDNDDDGNSTAINVLEDIRGFTFFAPNAEAFTSEFNDSLSDYQNNQSQLTTLIQNHFINGSTVYSPVLIQHAAGGGNQSDGGYGDLISAAGEGFTISQNDTGLFVSNGNGSSAQIVQSDVLVENGVVHVIDRFLINEASDHSAADSAYSSASSVATETSMDSSILAAASTSSSTSQASSTVTQTASASGATASGLRFSRI